MIPAKFRLAVAKNSRKPILPIESELPEIGIFYILSQFAPADNLFISTRLACISAPARNTMVKTLLLKPVAAIAAYIMGLECCPGLLVMPLFPALFQVGKF